jgi:hypothetical protein
LRFRNRIETTPRTSQPEEAGRRFRDQHQGNKPSEPEQACSLRSENCPATEEDGVCGRDVIEARDRASRLKSFNRDGLGGMIARVHAINTLSIDGSQEKGILHCMALTDAIEPK